MGKQSRKQGGRKGRESRYRTVPMTPEVFEAMKRQRQWFVEKFGREPGPQDPVFFDPAKDTPTPLDMDEMMRDFEAAADRAGLEPAISYAFKKTGLLVTQENQHLLSEEDLKEWREAIEEGRRLFRPH